MTPAARPTSVRFVMIAVTTLVAVMLYVDRVCLGILGEWVKPLLGDAPNERSERFDQLTSAFFWAYALFQLPAGWLGDRFGPRVVLAAYLFCWSACTAAMGLAGGFAGLFALRLGCGLFEAGAYPLAAGVVRRWTPFGVRGLASGVVAVGGRLGGAIAPPLTIFLAGTALAEANGALLGGTGLLPYSDRWRTPFYVYGLVGMVGAVLFALWYRNRPAAHPAVNAAEVELITRGALLGEPTRVGLPPLRGFVESRALWLMSAVQFISNFAWVFILAQFPAYLKDVFGTDEGTRAQYQSLPLYASIVGMLLGGWASDRLVRRFGLRWGRAIPVAVSRLLVGGAFVACLFLHDAFAVTLMMCVVAWATDVGVAPGWAYAQDVGGRHVGGVIGWANMWGNFGAAVSPLVLGRIFLVFSRSESADWGDVFGSFVHALPKTDGPPPFPREGWNAAFVVCAAVQVLGVLAACGVDAAKPIRGAER